MRTAGRKKERVGHEEKEKAERAAWRAEKGETARYRAPEAHTPWVRSRLEGLSQSPIDHGIQPVHDPMTLTIKPRKTRAKEKLEREPPTEGGKEKERDTEREREKETEEERRREGEEKR